MNLRMRRWSGMVVSGIAGIAALSSATSANALGAKTITGSHNGLTFTASSNVIGQTSTGTVVSGGNPIYLGLAPKYRGTVGLLMDYGAGGAFVCSGSLTADRKSIITAGHCIGANGTKQPDSVTAYFYKPGADPSAANGFETPVYTPGAPNVTTVAISQYHVNPLYTGNVIDDHDIAVLRLATAAPAYAVGYEMYTGSDLTGLDYNIAGYGRRSSGGGNVGANLGTGRLRQGDNRYDFRLGDPDFNGVLNSAFFGESGNTTAYSWIADFDNGLAANDASCGLATSNKFGLPGLAPSPKYCNLGRGATEVSTAGGDSGGPQFINGKLASVTSYGLTFGQDIQPGDIDNALNNTFGEFTGFVSVAYNADFINGVPEPATWAMMVSGFGLVGAATRRRRTTVAA